MVGRILTGALALVAAAFPACAAPLRAQEPDSAGACVAAAADADGLVRWTCTGGGYDAAVRFSAAFPEDWEVTPPDGAELAIWATGTEGGEISLSAHDQLHAPRTRSDSLGFWMRAAGLQRGRDPELAELGAFRAAAGDAAGARRAVTLAQQADSALLAVARGRSVARGGTAVLHQFAEVRTLAGQPAGFLEETYQTGGHTWRAATYVTVVDATVFVASFAAPEEAFNGAYGSWVQAVASLELGTERGESASHPGRCPPAARTPSHARHRPTAGGEAERGGEGIRRVPPPAVPNAFRG